MNIAKKISLFALMAVALTSCKDTANEAAPEAAATSTTDTETVVAATETTTFKIDGMTCPTGCAKVIENKLAGLDGVQEAKVDYENKTATISFDAAKQTPEKLVETVEHIADGAYTVSEVKNSGDKAELFKADQEPKKKKSKKKAEKNGESCGEKKGCCGGAGKKACGVPTEQNKA